MSSPIVVTYDIQRLVRRLWRWACKDTRQLWVQYEKQVAGRYKRTSTVEAHTLRLLLNNLLSEASTSVNVDDLEQRVERLLDHVRNSLKHSRANYENILTEEVMSVDDVAFKQAMKKHTFHELFGEGTPAQKTNAEDYYTRIGSHIDSLCDQYRVSALEEMNRTAQHIEEQPENERWAYSKGKQAWQQEEIQKQLDERIADVVPSKKAYDEAHKVTNVAGFLAKVVAHEDDTYLNGLIYDFVDDDKHDISFENLSNNARKKLLPKLQDAFRTIAKNIDDPTAVIYVKAFANGEWRTVKKLTPEEFESFMTQMFVRPEGGFIVQYTDNKHYDLTSGDNNKTAPAYIIERLHLDIATGAHKDGGNFCKYIYTGNDDSIRAYIREHYQIADHVPTKADTDLMVPCAIHAIMRGVTTRTGRALTKSLEDYLYTRIRTRYINASTLATLAEELHMQIEISDINGNPTHKYTAHGLKYSGYDTSAAYNWRHYDKVHQKEDKLFGTKSKTLHAEKYYKYKVKLVLWDDHFFVNETTPFSKQSYQLVRGLFDNGELKPMNLLQCNIYSTQLPEYKVKQISWEESMFMTPQQVYAVLKSPPQPYLPLHDSITDITKANIAQHIDELSDNVLPQLGYKLFVEELIQQNLNVYADSSIPKNFIRQSIKGPRFAIAHGQICGPTTILDRNSNHSYALSQIDFPLGRPRTSTSADILTKPMFVVDAEVQYTPQHELDHGFSGRCVINSIDAQAPGLTITKVYRGYWWSEVAKQPMKQLMSHLYDLRKLHPKMKTLMNSIYGKLIQKAPDTVVANSQTSMFNISSVRTNPLIKSFDINADGNTVYRYYNDSDFTYNYTIIASLLLAQQRKNMRDVFKYCTDNKIPMYYSAADSIAIPSDKLSMMQQFMGSGLGQFKIEAEGPVAVFVKPGLYFCGSKVVTSLPHMSAEDITAWCTAHALTVEQMYKNIVAGEEYTLDCGNGLTRKLTA